MMRMTVKIYTYDGLSCEINLGGYNYAPGVSWYNTFADMTTGSRTPLNVRWGNDGTYCCMYIGETSSTWNYPQVFVTDFQAGYSNYAASQWGSGWSIGFATSFGTLTGGTISTAGVVYGSVGNFTGEVTAYYSDRRLKDNIKPIDNAVDKVLKLNGITYNPNDLAASFGHDKTLDIVGLFADEVEAVLPEAVKLAPFDRDQDGNSKSGENYKTVQYEKVVPLLVEAIKEQQETIKDQNDKISRLEALVEKLLNK